MACGKGRGAYVDGYRVGGKMGKAQVIIRTGGYESGHYILSFLGYGTYELSRNTLVFSNRQTKKLCSIWWIY